MSSLQMTLQSLSPTLYEFMIEKFVEDFHIHSYDIQIDAVEKEGGLHIFVKYGKRFDVVIERFFTYDSLKMKGEPIIDFIKQTGEACQKELIDEYFRTMTP